MKVTVIKPVACAFCAISIGEELNVVIEEIGEEIKHLVYRVSDGRFKGATVPISNCR